MTVTNISPAANQYTNTVQSPWKQEAKDFKALRSALKSGDLSGAQTAFAALQQDAANTSQTASSTSGSTSASGQPDPLTSAFQALQSALQSGNLSGAQSAFASIQEDLQNSGSTQSAHHHHHHHGADAASGSSQGPGTESTSASSVSPLLDAQA
jgi:hypothetical protein